MNIPKKRRRESDPSPKYDAHLAYSTDLLNVMESCEDSMRVKMASGVNSLVAVQGYMNDVVQRMTLKASEYETAGDTYLADFFRKKIAASVKAIMNGPVDVHG